ncbi:hypothetical protein AAMO2058_000003100 [Amorphochlora amoebiformis]
MSSRCHLRDLKTRFLRRIATKHTSSMVPTRLRCFGRKELLKAKGLGAQKRRFASQGPGDSNTGIFVSKYVQMDPNDIISYIHRKGIEYKHLGNKLRCRCPFCLRRPIDSQSSGDLGSGMSSGSGFSGSDHTGEGCKFYVFLNNGDFRSYCCNRRGTWYDLKTVLGDISDVMSLNSRYTHYTPPPPHLPGGQGGVPGGGGYVRPEIGYNYPLPPPETVGAFSENLRRHRGAMQFLAGQDAKKGERGISNDTLIKYNVGLCYATVDNTETPCIALPWTERTDEKDCRIIRWKLLPLKSDGGGGGLVVKGGEDSMFLPEIGVFGFFGEHIIKPDDEFVVICESEWDAMIIHQYTDVPAIALPNNSRELPPALIGRLERFSKIYLWLKNDPRSQDQAHSFARKLGISRTYNIKTCPPHMRKDGKPRTPPSFMRDASELVFSLGKGWADLARKASKELKEALDSAKAFPHEQITDFSELRREVLDEFVNADGYQGLKSTSFPTLTRILKGFRRGELSIVTGPTGVGKTSFLSQISLDYAQQGVQTLWGSFEIKNARLAKRMLTQHARKDFTQSIEGFHKAADDFQQLPIYFLRFFGMTDVQKVLDAMDYAVYVYDVHHILLDNLQFMMGLQHGGFRTKFDAQDNALDLFRRFSTKHNVHITLVIHPRKEMDSAQLGISSIFGTAKASQEADNIIILQKPEAMARGSKFKPNEEIDYRVMDIKKNRFDGEVGAVPYRFEKNIVSMTELSDLERMKIGLPPVIEEFPDPVNHLPDDRWEEDVEASESIDFTEPTEPTEVAESTEAKEITEAMRPSEAIFLGSEDVDFGISEPRIGVEYDSDGGSEPVVASEPTVAPKLTEPSGSEPSGSEPRGSEPSGSKPTGSEPKGSEPKGSEPKGSEPRGSEPKGGKESKKREPFTFQAVEFTPEVTWDIDREE